jgi:hypothetical protein
MFKELYRLFKIYTKNNNQPDIDPFYINDEPYDSNDSNDSIDPEYNDNDDNNDSIDADYYNYNDRESDSDIHYHSDIKLPSFITSMNALDKHIKKIEKSIQFIKGKYKYTLLTILHKLKLQYHKDTIQLLHYWNNRFI